MSPWRRRRAATQETGSLGRRTKAKRAPATSPAQSPVEALRSRLAPASLYVHAVDFLRAAKSTAPARKPVEKRFRPARLYLACHALELGFRAFLTLRIGPQNESVRRAVGHDLGRLQSKADSLGLGHFVRFRAKEVAEMRKASVYHARRIFEYPAAVEAIRGYPMRPDFNILLAAADRLLIAIRDPCLAQN